VAGLLGATTNPPNPEQVSVGRPSDARIALTARIAVAGSGAALFLGLGAIALLVAGIGIGIANIMVISVLERRGAARSGCAGRWARRGGMWRRSSSPSRSCRPRSARWRA
jgi:hypothetical protein